MANVFDQFDGPTSNPFDQFDTQRPTSAAPQSGGYGSQVFSGLMEGATGALGAPVDLMNNFVVAPALKGVNAVFGTNYQPSAEPLGGSAGLRRGLAIAPQSDSAGEQMVRRVAQSVGGAAVPLAGAPGSIGQMAAGLLTAAGGGVGGAIAQQAFPDSPLADMAGDLIGSAGTGAAISGLANRSARIAAERAVPSIDDLRDRASNLYDAAEARGVVAAPSDTTALAARVKQIARDNELITPTGRVSGAYPRAAEAMNLLDDYSGHPMNPTQMQVIRDTLADARNATNGKERRIASKMLDEFDRFTSPLAPELETARAVSQRAIKAQQLETMREVAEANSSRFSASGGENAMREQYRNLDKRIVKGQERGWSPAEAEAIQRVGRGTTASNTARNVGKIAPTGVVSLGAGAGVPFMIGNAIGGPGVGAALSGATMGAGFLAREAATRMGMRNADLAELIARNGGAINPAPTDALRRKIFEAIMGTQAANAGSRR